MTSMEPARSSISARAYALPLALAILRLSEVIIPAMVTIEPSGGPSSAMIEVIECSACWLSSPSSPCSGWSET